MVRKYGTDKIVAAAFAESVRLWYVSLKYLNKSFVPVNASMKLNKKLTFINEHQNCVLDVYKGKLEKKTQDLIISEAKRASSSNDECYTKDMETPSLVHLENELRMVGGKQTNGPTDGRTDRRTDGWTDRPTE